MNVSCLDMKLKELVCVLFALPILVLGHGDIYLVTIEGDPVVSYSGGVEGFAATAADLAEELDITR